MGLARDPGSVARRYPKLGYPIGTMGYLLAMGQACGGRPAIDGADLPTSPEEGNTPKTPLGYPTFRAYGVVWGTPFGVESFPSPLTTPYPGYARYPEVSTRGGCGGGKSLSLALSRRVTQVSSEEDVGKPRVVRARLPGHSCGVRPVVRLDGGIHLALVALPIRRAGPTATTAAALGVG